ncbi:MAG: glutamyl-tRNA reductase [Candidatus Omnitrophota bacterium]
MNQKQLVVVGLNHRTATVALRERFAVSQEKLPGALNAFKQRTGIPSCVLLSTCNRTELYTLVSRRNGELSRVKTFFADYHHVEPSSCRDALYVMSGEKGVRHLFQVASGLDSLVIGESEITGQVKQAYQAAQQARQVDKTLHFLFQRSLRIAKKIRTETQIGRGHLSVGSVAVDLAEKIFGSLRDRILLVVGAGQMGELAAQHLLKKGVAVLTVLNRSIKKAQTLAEKLGGFAVTLEHLAEHMERADMVISSASCPHFIVTQKLALQVMKARQGRPLFLIDIAVPRNVDPRVGQIDHVFLYNMDDLEKITRLGQSGRAAAVGQGMSLVRNEARRCMELLTTEMSRG